MRKILFLMLASCLCMALLPACKRPSSDTSQGGGVSPIVQNSSQGSESIPQTSAPDQSESLSQKVSPEQQVQTFTLYIGTEDSFQEYPQTYEGDLTPEKLIAEMSALTGWNLDLDDVVTSGKGGMTVPFSRNCAIFTGPPDPQKDEFHVFDVESLTRTILDSIKKTLQMNFVGENGNPDLLDIYYCVETDQPLEIPDLGLSLPLDQPYSWDVMVRAGE